MSDDLEDFKEFMQRRKAAANSYVNGDAAPLEEISARELPATFFSPKGDFQKGAAEVIETYKSDANSFENGGATEFQIFQMAAEGGIAYWVGLQIAYTRIKGRAEPVQFRLRVTEIFRREEGVWKLVHRHADEHKPEWSLEAKVNTK